MSPEELQRLNGEFDQFEIIAPLGKGGMGTVLKARQTSLNRFVAVKILSREEEEQSGHFAERFQKEAQVLAQLNHPNIVTIYDFGYSNYGRLFIAMEFVDGSSLEERMREGGLTVADVVEWIPQICSALQVAHDLGIVHRDIKPSNVLIGDDGRVKVADFGLARMQLPGELSLTSMDATPGTPDYIAPELIESGTKPDSRSDIYSLGVLLYQLLTGRLPKGAWRLPSEYVPDLDRRFDEVVLRALDSSPESRYQSASEVSSDLERISSEPVATAKGSADTHSGGRMRNVVVGAAVLLLVLVGVFVWIDRIGRENVSEEDLDPVAAQLAQSVAEDTERPEEKVEEGEGGDPGEGKREAAQEGAYKDGKSEVAVVSDTTQVKVEIVPEEKVKTGEGVGENAKTAPEQQEKMVETSKPPPAKPDKPTPPPGPTEEEVKSAIREIDSWYAQQVAEKVDPWVKEEYVKLNALYRNALQKKIHESRRKKRATEMALLEREMKRVPWDSALSLEGNALVDALHSLREIYREQKVRIETDRIGRLTPLLEEKLKRFRAIPAKPGGQPGKLVEVAVGEVKASMSAEPEVEILEVPGNPWLTDIRIANGYDIIEVAPVAREGKKAISDVLSGVKDTRFPEFEATVLLEPGQYPGEADKGKWKPGSPFYIPAKINLAGNQSWIDENLIVKGDYVDLSGVECGQIQLGEIGGGQRRLLLSLDGCRFERLVILSGNRCYLDNCVGSIFLEVDADVTVRNSTIIPPPGEPNAPAVEMLSDSRITAEDSIFWSREEIFRIDGQIERSRLGRSLLYTKSLSVVRDTQGVTVVSASNLDAMSKLNLSVSYYSDDFVDPQFLDPENRNFHVGVGSPARDPEAVWRDPDTDEVFVVPFPFQIKYGAFLDRDGWPVSKTRAWKYRQPVKEKP